MRNKYAPKRGGDTGRNTSNRSAPKKGSKPDKSKGLANHIFSSGKSEDFQKTCECLMSCIRLHYDNGDDIATATEDGKPCDFSKEMPTMATPTPPTEQEAKGDPKKQQACEDKVKALELRLKVQMQAFAKREETHNENIVKACTLLMQQCAEKMENQLKNRDDFSSTSKNMRKDFKTTEFGIARKDGKLLIAPS